MPFIVPRSVVSFLRCRAYANGQAGGTANSEHRTAATDYRDEVTPLHVQWRLPPYALSPADRPVRTVYLGGSLPQGGRQVLGADLNCSESDSGRPLTCLRPYRSRIAHRDGGRVGRCQTAADFSSSTGRRTVKTDPLPA